MNCFKLYENISNFFLIKYINLLSIFSSNESNYYNDSNDESSELLISNDKTKFYYLSLIKNGNSWHIHGLWPQYSLNQYPTFCKKVNFDYDKLSPIINELNTYWYSTEETNEEFWKHEWEKHGSCMFTYMDELTYFKTTLSLYLDAIDLKVIDKFTSSNNPNKSMIPVNLELKIIH